ncbi:unnamed protein product, partial [Allacma fusca]
VISTSRGRSVWLGLVSSALHFVSLSVFHNIETRVSSLRKYKVCGLDSFLSIRREGGSVEVIRRRNYYWEILLTY